MSRLVRLASYAVLALAVSGASARATTVISKSFAALCAEADMIFAATVSAVRSQPVGAEHGHIETFVTFADIDPLFGVTAPTVMLRFSGGVVDGVREEFLGVPRFAIGERVVLFARHGYEVSPIVGLSQGCFRVVETASGAMMAAADGQPLATLDSGDGAEGGRAAGNTRVSLDRFLHEVRNELSAQGRHH